MNPSYVCTSCRARLSLLRFSGSRPQQRRWLSQAIALKQDARRGIDRSSYRNKDVQASWRADQVPSQRVEGEVRGRYSGQVLRPEQLLDQLDVALQQPYDHGPRRPAERGDERGQGVRRPLESATTDMGFAARSTQSLVSRMQASDVPRPLWELRGKFLRAGKTPEDDEIIWVMLEEVMRTHGGHAGMKRLGQDHVFRRAYYFWIVRTCEQWLQPFRDGQLGTTNSPGHILSMRLDRSPLQALQYWIYFGTPSRATFPRVLWTVARDVAEFFATLAKSSNVVPEAVVEGLRQLMGIWHLCMVTNTQRLHSPQFVYTSALLDGSFASRGMDWAFLPDPVAFAESLRRKAQQRATRMALHEVLDLVVRGSWNPVPNSENNEAEASQLWDYESATVVTLELLQRVKPHKGGTEAVRHFEPWSELMEMAVKSVTAPKVPAALMQRKMQLTDDGVKRDFYEDMIRRWKLDPARKEEGTPVENLRKEDAINEVGGLQDAEAAALVEASPQDLIQNPTVPTKDVSATDRFTYLSINRLRRAVEGQDLRDVERVRQDIVSFNIRNSTIQMPQALYEHLILAYLRLRSLPTGIEIWNEMIKTGHRPTSKTFTVMMRGSQHLRDLDSMEYFWNLIRRAKMQPDKHAWSTRIHGLLMRGHTDAGLRALFEMGQDWLAAAKAAYAREHPSSKKKGAHAVKPSELLAGYEGDVDGVPRPDIIIMNSAVSALARRDNHPISKVLSWGRFFGLEPDLVTYNALLNVSMRHGLVTEALNIFKRMQDRNIEADSTTWTVLMTAMFEGGFINGLEPQEQETKVLDFMSSLESMSAAGMDQKGYALIIDRLLKDYDNPQAAQAVLAHMAARGVEANVHIYTILMDSYFSQSPPNVAAAEDLWARIQSSKGGYGANLDTAFYNRMIEGYAANHASIGTTRMLSLLSRMDSEGKIPSWNAMERVANALSEAQEWERLAQIVDRTRRRLREQRGADTRHGQNDFWRLIISTGMLSHEGITAPEQIMQMEDPLNSVQA